LIGLINIFIVGVVGLTGALNSFTRW